MAARWDDAPPALYIALKGLERVVRGGSVDESRRLLGWTVGPHWMWR